LRGTTLVLVTHDPELANVAHMSIALRDGRVASQTKGSRAPIQQAEVSAHTSSNAAEQVLDRGRPTPDPGPRIPDPGF
jgi:ABC-type lipoprotein export system ATPase subunit